MSRMFWLVLILALLFTGCQKKESGPGPSPIKTSPLPKPALDSSSSPAPTAAEATLAPTSQPGLGTITGTLVEIKAGQPSEPNVGALLYLAILIYSDDGNSSMASLDKTRAPGSISDQDGRFVFSNVEPGTYALVYSLVTVEFLLKDPNSNEDLLITVVADQTVDLGEIFVELPD